MEDKYKSVNLEIKSVLQSRNSLAEELKASKYDLECRLADKSCELALIKKKLGRHASLFEVFEREASDVHRAVDETCQLVSSKEEQICSEAATSTEDLNNYLDSAKDFQTTKETRNEPHCSNKRIFYASETCIADGIPIQTSSEDKDPAAFLGNETTEFKMVQQDNEILETSQTFPGAILSSCNGSIPFIDIEELSTTVSGLSNQVPGHFEVTSTSMTDSNFEVIANNQSLLENCDMHLGTDGEQSVQKLSCSEQIKIPNVSKFDYRTMLQEKTDSLLLGNEKSMETGRNLNQQSRIQDDTKASLRMLNSIMFRLGRPLPQSQAHLPDSSNLPSICHTIRPQEGNGVSGQHFPRMSSLENGLEEEEKLRVPKEDTTNKSETFLENLQESDCTSTSIEQNKSCTRKSEITDNRWPIARTKPNKICETPDDTSNKNTEALNESISPRVSSQKDDAASITSSVDAIVQATKPEVFLENMSMPITDSVSECPSDSGPISYKATQLQSTAEEASSVVAASVDFSTAWNATMTRTECLELSHGCLTPQASQIGSPEVLAAKSVEEKLSINEVANQVMEKENDVSLHNQQHTKISLSATACICYNPPFGYMVSCETCRMQFHAGCISWKSTTSGYVCDECKTKPRKRRRRNT